jgi:RND family efflux transporter MFP subunit
MLTNTNPTGKLRLPRHVWLSAVYSIATGLLTLAASGCGPEGAAEKTELPPALVTVARPAMEKVTAFTDLTGTLDSPNTVQLRPRVSGYILEVKMKDGQDVKAGDVLFVIDPVTYKADLQKADAEVKSAEAKFKEASAQEARFKDLLAKKAVSQEEYDIRLAQKEVTEASIFAAKGDVTIAQQNLEWTKVVAPIAGRVDRAYVTKGNVATGGMSQGTVLTTIVSSDPMYAYIDVDDQTVMYFQKLAGKERPNPTSGAGIPATLQLQGEKGFPHSGTIDFVSNRINPSTGSLQVRGTFPNPDHLLLPGRYVRVRVPVGAQTEAMLLPEAAVMTDQGQKVVFVVNAENKVEARVVRLGPTARGLRVVSEGLKPDERVVIKGMQRVRPGVKVEPEEGKITPAKETAE